MADQSNPPFTPSRADARAFWSLQGKRQADHVEFVRHDLRADEVPIRWDERLHEPRPVSTQLLGLVMVKLLGLVGPVLVTGGLCLLTYFALAVFFSAVSRRELASWRNQ